MLYLEAMPLSASEEGASAVLVLPDLRCYRNRRFSMGAIFLVLNLVTRSQRQSICPIISKEAVHRMPQQAMDEIISHYPPFTTIFVHSTPDQNFDRAEFVYCGLTRDLIDMRAYAPCSVNLAGD